MSDILIILLVLLLFCASGYICYQEGFKRGNAQATKILNELSLHKKRRITRKEAPVFDSGNLLDPITPAEQRLEMKLEEQRRKTNFDEEVDY